MVYVKLLQPPVVSGDCEDLVHAERHLGRGVAQGGRAGLPGPAAGGLLTNQR